MVNDWTSDWTNDWANVIGPELDKAYYQELQAFLVQEYCNGAVYPPEDAIYAAFHRTPFEQVKVVILGQDPYHGPGQAHGLSFSVQQGVKQPPSLVNMFKELQDDLGLAPPKHGCLEAWAEQGVFLLNTTLTVRDGWPMSHQGKGWELFTDRVIEALNQRERPMVFMLWGSHAQKKRVMIDTNRHLIIASPHPSPLSAYRGFFGSKPYSRANAFLVANGMEPVDWQL
jgi:uracil-DNA glycosylase